MEVTSGNLQQSSTIETVIVGAWVESNLHPKEVEYIYQKFPYLNNEHEVSKVEKSTVESFNKARKNSMIIMDMYDYFKDKKDKKGMRIIRKILN